MFSISIYLRAGAWLFARRVAGEILKTLDGVERKLSADDLSLPTQRNRSGSPA